MCRYLKSKKLLFALAVIIIMGLNFYTLSIAYPTMNRPLSLAGADLPRDFSVYYIAAWRMFHNPSQIFTAGHLSDSEPTIYPSLTPTLQVPALFPRPNFSSHRPRLLPGILGF